MFQLRLGLQPLECQALCHCGDCDFAALVRKSEHDIMLQLIAVTIPNILFAIRTTLTVPDPSRTARNDVHHQWNRDDLFWEIESAVTGWSLQFVQ